MTRFGKGGRPWRCLRIELGLGSTKGRCDHDGGGRLFGDSGVGRVALAGRAIFVAQSVYGFFRSRFTTGCATLAFRDRAVGFIRPAPSSSLHFLASSLQFSSPVLQFPSCSCSLSSWHNSSFTISYFSSIFSLHQRRFERQCCSWYSQHWEIAARFFSRIERYP